MLHPERALVRARAHTRAVRDVTPGDDPRRDLRRSHPTSDRRAHGAHLKQTNVTMALELARQRMWCGGFATRGRRRAPEPRAPTAPRLARGGYCGVHQSMRGSHESAGAGIMGDLLPR